MTLAPLIRALTTDRRMGAPLLAGAIQVTAAALTTPMADTAVGAFGTPTTTVAEAADSGPTPFELTAATLKVYVWALVRPVMVWVVAAELKVRVGWATVPWYGVTR